LALERRKLKKDNKGERQALAAIYVARGLEPLLANQVAQQLDAYDELGTYARDELGISEKFRNGSGRFAPVAPTSPTFDQDRNGASRRSSSL
jgi:VIT1/CCC1 family predicted Fe2+/Mn2+ transporter